MSAVIRLTFEHSADGVTLISRQRVEMTLPAQQQARDEAAVPEFVAEVRGSDDRVLHRAAMANPLESHREVFSEEPGRSIHRVPVEQPEGVFTVLVPDHPDADHVALLAAVAPADGARAELTAGAPAPGGLREIARVPLREHGETGAKPS